MIYEAEVTRVETNTDGLCLRLSNVIPVRRSAMRSYDDSVTFVVPASRWRSYPVGTMVRIEVRPARRKP